MIPPLKSPSFETVEVGTSFTGKRERCNTGGSSKSGGGGPGPIMSMDLNFLKPEDVELDGGLSAFGRIRSSDYVEDFLLPDTAETAAGALEALQPPRAQDPIPIGDEKPSFRRPERSDEFCPVLNLTARMERITTGEEVAPLSEDFRISSSDWAGDFKGESADLGPTHPSLFMGSRAATATQQQQQQTAEVGRVGTGDSGVWLEDFSRESVDSQPMHPSMFEQANAASGQVSITPLSYKLPSHFDEYQVPIQPLSHPPIPQMHPLSNHIASGVHSLPPLTARPVPKGKSTSPSSSTTSKKKRKKKRFIDETRAVEPNDNDVLFGRGGYTNTHLGNIKFRKRALELRPWYEQSSTSKEEKYRISDLLVESVRSEGHRFLEKGDGGLWHEVIGNGARKKASQALRERVKGVRRPAGGNSSSIKSKGGVEEAIGDMMTATVDDVVAI